MIIIKKTNNSWWSGSSDRMPAYKHEALSLNPSFTKTKTKNQTKQIKNK
jgi:hypothetical protein